MAGNTDPHLISEWEVFQQIAELNKNRYYYYYCVDIKDYVFQKKEGKDKLMCLELPKYVCLKTYIPNFKSFEKLLEELESLVLSQRCTALKQYKQFSAEVLTALNSWECTLESDRILQKSDLLSSVVLELHEKEIQGGSIPAKVALQHSKRDFSIQYPECPLEFVEALSAVEQVLEGFSAEEVLLCFFCLINEISLVFVGNSQRQISSAM